MADAARELGIELDQPENVNAEEAMARIADASPDAVCLCAFGALIREPLLSAHEIFNVHPSLLPRWRGAAPVERAIQAGDRETGVSIMRLVDDLDAGPVYLAGAEPIGRTTTTAPSLRAWPTLGGELLVRALDERPEPAPQPDEGVTYAEKIDRSERRLDPERPAEELARTVRALTPHIGAFVELGGRGAPGRAPRSGASTRRGPAPGELDQDDGRLLFGTATGRSSCSRCSRRAGARWTPAAYLRGRVRAARQDSPMADANDRPRARVPVLRRAVAAPHQPAGPLPLRELPARASSCARIARAAARTPRSRACPTPRT